MKPLRIDLDDRLAATVRAVAHTSSKVTKLKSAIWEIQRQIGASKQVIQVSRELLAKMANKECVAALYRITTEDRRVARTDTPLGRASSAALGSGCAPGGAREARAVDRGAPPDESG